jgi:hypothetical protein
MITPASNLKSVTGEQITLFTDFEIIFPYPLPQKKVCAFLFRMRVLREQMSRMKNQKNDRVDPSTACSSKTYNTHELWLCILDARVHVCCVAVPTL